MWPVQSHVTFLNNFQARVLYLKWVKLSNSYLSYKLLVASHITYVANLLHKWAGQGHIGFTYSFLSLKQVKLWQKLTNFSLYFILYYVLQCHWVPSVLWRCWLGGRKGIRPVKNWVVGCWCGCLGWGADLHIAQQMPLHPLSLAPVNPDWFKPFWFTFLVPAHPGCPGHITEEQ